MNVSCSARMLGPFLRLVAESGEHRDLVPEDFWTVRAESRVSLEAARAMLDRGVERLRNERLGLKLGKTMRFGEGGAFDYVLRSAATLRASVEVASRYATLHSDRFRIGLETWRSYAVIQLEDETWSRPCSEFAMSAFYAIHASHEVPPASGLECWFPHAKPRDTSDFERAFAGAEVKFGAPFFGFAFNRSYVNAPMAGADHVLHQAHCDRVDSMMVALSDWHAVRGRVRRFIQEELRNTRGATLTAVARAMRMTARTMSRRLEQEGTTFVDELDHARRELAIAYVAEFETPLKEIAFALGFSHPESFYRAFRRWTGDTPQAYRSRANIVRSPG
jgi:AraC-like DNA-binding protein